MKKSLICILILALLFNIIVYSDEVSTSGVSPNIDTDGSRSAVTWFQVFDNLLTDKVSNGVKFFLVLSSLRDVSLENQINTVLESNTERKNLLQRYGLRQDSIYYLMAYYMSTFPRDMYEVRYNYVEGENIYSDIYYEDEFYYSSYMVRFYLYLNDLFRQLPGEMQSVISKYDRLNAGEIIVMQGLMNIVIRDYLAFETYNSLSNNVMTQDLRLRNEIRQDLINELVEAANTYPEDYTGDTSVDMNEITEYVDAFMALGNVMLESIELNLKTNNQMQYAIDLMRDSNLLVRTPVTPSQALIEITLSMNTDYVELDSSDPISDNYINSFQLVPTVGGTGNPVIYTSDNPLIAKVDKNGLVTLSTEKQGIARITATVKGFNVYKEIIIDVSEKTPLGGVSFYGAYISGYPNGTFQTDRFITRGEIAAMMVRVLRLDVKANNEKYSPLDFKSPSYIDVSPNHWAYTYLEIAKKEGIISGYSDNSFKPDAFVARDQMAVIISNAWDRLNIKQEIASKHFIKDVEPNHWAFDAINKVYNAKIVKGYEDGTFRPEGFTSRGEIVTMINKIINRNQFKPPVNSFSDVKNDHWAYGNVEAATRMQEIREN